jgi:diguanylate cyclase (GGDEF)-like protein
MATTLFGERELSVPALSRPAPVPDLLLGAAEPQARAPLLALLHGWGHSVEVAGDGDSLLQALDRNEMPPVVILDNELPGLRGVALLNRLQLQSARRRSWIILLASEALNHGGKKPQQEAGIDDVLAKPIDELELRISLRAASRLRVRLAEMAEAVEAATFHASHDSLTGLLNRDALLQKLFQETDRAQRLGTPLTFLVLDVDRFAAVNREYGYDAGDRVLRQLASRLRRFLRSYDIAGRCGVDQFLIAMPGCTVEDAGSMALRLRDAISGRPFDVLQTTLNLHASLGIAASGGRSPLAVLREAESALASAKLAGGDCLRYFLASSGDAPAAPVPSPAPKVTSVPA